MTDPKAAFSSKGSISHAERDRNLFKSRNKSLKKEVERLKQQKQNLVVKNQELNDKVLNMTQGTQLNRHEVTPAETTAGLEALTLTDAMDVENDVTMPLFKGCCYGEAVRGLHQWSLYLHRVQVDKFPAQVIDALPVDQKEMYRRRGGPECTRRFAWDFWSRQ
jgi:hypothetical protein